MGGVQVLVAALVVAATKLLVLVHRALQHLLALPHLGELGPLGEMVPLELLGNQGVFDPLEEPRVSLEGEPVVSLGD